MCVLVSNVGKVLSKGHSALYVYCCSSMNPLTQIKNTQKITKKEIELGLFEKASWHDRFKHSAYIFAGGLDYDLTEGDLLAVFAQYGELVDVHLARDKQSGKSRGFAFLAYEDQRSTVLAVDNLNGATVAGRKVRVEHVDNYRKRKAEVCLLSCACVLFQLCMYAVFHVA